MLQVAAHGDIIDTSERLLPSIRGLPAAACAPAMLQQLPHRSSVAAPPLQCARALTSLP